MYTTLLIIPRKYCHAAITLAYLVVLLFAYLFLLSSITCHLTQQYTMRYSTLLLLFSTRQLLSTLTLVAVCPGSSCNGKGVSFRLSPLLVTLLQTKPVGLLFIVLSINTILACACKRYITSHLLTYHKSTLQPLLSISTVVAVCPVLSCNIHILSFLTRFDLSAVRLLVTISP